MKAHFLQHALLLTTVIGAFTALPAAAQSPGTLQSMSLLGATSESATSLAVEVKGITGSYCNFEIRRADGRSQQFSVHAGSPFPVSWKHDDISLGTLTKHAAAQGMLGYFAIGVPSATRPACEGRAEVVFVSQASSATPQKKK
ncbi:MAG: hypothetical protein JNM76_02510 [Betaproteobacteria bacterium]|nr:hypothetical protein [Betaproteobacteria bacterium]